jgi:hypothetical protein
MDDPETISTVVKRPFWTAKRIVLAESLGFVTVVAGLSIGLIRFPTLSTALSVINMLGCGVWMLAWIKADSRERGYALHRRFPLIVVVFGIFALIYYLFRSRGFLRGLAGVAYFLLFSILTLITAVVAGSLVLIIMVMIIGPEALKGH